MRAIKESKRLKEVKREIEIKEKQIVENIISSVKEKGDKTQKERFKDWKQEKDGILTGEIFKPLQKVGIYVPAGKAPLPSSLLMAAIPAQIAGVERIVIATPPKKDGVDVHILATANILGI